MLIGNIFPVHLFMIIVFSVYIQGGNKGIYGEEEGRQNLKNKYFVRQYEARRTFFAPLVF